MADEAIKQGFAANIAKMQEEGTLTREGNANSIRSLKESLMDLETSNKDGKRETRKASDAQLAALEKGRRMQGTPTAAEKEKAADEEARQNRLFTLLGKIGGGIKGLAGKGVGFVKGEFNSLKDKVVKFVKAFKSVFIVGGIGLLMEFFGSERFTALIKSIKNFFDKIKPTLMEIKDVVVKKFKSFIDDITKFFNDPSFDNIFKLITDNKAVLAGLVLLLKPKLFIGALSLGFKALKKGMGIAGKAIGKLSDGLPGGRGGGLPGGRGGGLAGGRGRQPGRIMRAAKGISKLGRAAGRGIGGFIGGVLKGIAGGLAAIANPLTLIGLGAVTLAINGIAFAIRVASPAFEPFGKMMESFGESVKTVFSGLGVFIKDIGKTIEGIVTKLGAAIGAVVDKISKMSTAGTEATTKQIKELSAIPADGMIAAAKGIDAMKNALNDFGGGTFSKIADNLFGGGGPIDKIVELSKKVPELMKAAEAINVLSAAGSDFALAEEELNRRKRIAELKKGIADESLKGKIITSEEDLKKARVELAALKEQGSLLPAQNQAQSTASFNTPSPSAVEKTMTVKMLQAEVLNATSGNLANQTNNISDSRVSTIKADTFNTSSINAGMSPTGLVGMKK